MSLVTCAAPADTGPATTATAVRAPTAGSTGLRVAITIDDLPWHGAPAPGETRMQATRRLLDALIERDAHATGFVNCSRIDPGEPIVETWLAAGMNIGNHGSRHLDINRTELDEWIADVEDCHDILSRISPRPVRYFRYPMLHQGATEARRSAAEAALERLGYTVAHVTIDNSEWLLASAYARVLEHADTQAQETIARTYIQHVIDGVHHFDTMARHAEGRTIPHILLLHANALAADHLGALIDALRARGVRIVPLAEALADPVFSREDTYVGPKGLSWLYRIRPDLLERWGGWDDDQAEGIRKQFL